MVSPTEAAAIECKEAVMKLDLVGSHRKASHNEFFDMEATLFPLRQK